MSQMTRVEAAMLAAVARNWQSFEPPIWRLAYQRNL
jgi:hypothetical protein